MPYEVRKVGKGYKVGHIGQSKTYSDKPISKSMAKKQMAAMYSSAKKDREGGIK